MENNTDKLIDVMNMFSLPVEHWWDIRITDIENTVPRVKLLDWLSGLGTYHIGGEEFAKNHHYHIAFHDESLGCPKSIIAFRDSLYAYFNPPKKGNAFYSLKPVKDIQQCFPYHVKDGLGFCSSQGNMDTIFQIARDISFKKPSGFVKQKEQLFEEFVQNPKILPEQLWIDLCQIRAHLGDLDFNKVDREVRAAIIQRDPSSLQFLAKQRKFLPEIILLP